MWSVVNMRWFLFVRHPYFLRSYNFLIFFSPIILLVHLFLSNYTFHPHFFHLSDYTFRPFFLYSSISSMVGKLPMQWKMVKLKQGQGLGKIWGHTCNSMRDDRLLYVFGGYSHDGRVTNKVFVFNTGKFLC